MIYDNVHDAVFVSRPNRFIAHVEIGGEIVAAHVKNTGRCRELLISGARVILQKSENPNRKTLYDLISVWKGERLINMDSQAPNKVFLEYLKSGKYIDGITHIKPEAKYGNSRFDFYVEADKRKIFIEVKGVTLEENGVVMFPDAPTERGVKHLRELMNWVRKGHEAHAVFVIQMSGMRYFMPNNRTHEEFGNALREAKAVGVKITALDCAVEPDMLEIHKEIEVKL